MIIKITRTGQVTQVQPQVVRIVRVYDHPVPAGILEAAYTQKGGVLAGTGPGTYAEHAPGSSGQYLSSDPSSPTGLIWTTPSIAITDATNFLLNGGFDFAQRTTPGTLTSVSDNAYGADRWKQTRENADLQYQRNDATSETGLTSRYYGKYKKITNAGKFMVFQILEGQHTVPLRGKTVIFQVKMKASTAKTIRMAILELQSGGTMDTIPGTFVSAWNVDGTDPTLGANLAIITGAESKAVTTSWQNFTVSVTVPSTSKNLICAVWANADFSAADELNLAEAGLFLGASQLSWTPRNIALERTLCSRYYYKTFPLDTAPAQNAGVAGAHRVPAPRAGAAVEFTSLRLPVPLRTTPASVTFYNPSAANAQMRDSSAGADCTLTALSASGNSAELITFQATGNAATVVGNALDVHLSADVDL